MNRTLLSAVLLFCFPFFIGCDRIYGLLQKEGAEEKHLVGNVIPYEKNVKVAEVQRLLKLYGYRIGKADGILGANTRNAIEAFQKDNDLPVTRFVDKPTWQRLNLFESSGLVVKGAANMKMVQKALKEAGYNVGAIDGKAGERTKAALVDFQKRSGLKPDGKIGYKTLRKLAEYLIPEDEQGAVAGDKTQR